MDWRKLLWRRLKCVGVAALLAVGLPFALSGCNTVEGAGEDIEEVGEGISDAADGA